MTGPAQSTTVLLMALINLPVLVTTDAVACECGERDCFFCEPFAGVSDEEMMEIIYSCPKCHAYPSEEHDEDCRYGIAARRFVGEVV